MAAGDGAEVSIVLAPVEDSGVGRQGETGPAQWGEKGTLLFDVSSWVVGCCAWDQYTEGRCRSGYVMGLTSSTLEGPRPILQRTFKYTRKLAKGSLGGEVYARSDVVGHMMLLKDFYGPLEGVNPDLGALEDCESLSPTWRQKRRSPRSVCFADSAGPRKGRIGERLLVSGNGEPH